MVLRRWVDGVANACDAYRGLRPAIGGFNFEWILRWQNE